MLAILRDLRHGFRVLRRNPIFSVTAILTLGVGIGANTALFSMVEAVLLRPLHYRSPSRLAALWESNRKNPKGFDNKRRVTPANFLDWQQQCLAAEKMAAFGAALYTLTGEGEPLQLRGGSVSAEYFEVLGVAPLLGRSFAEGEDGPGAEAVVALSHRLWQSRFGGDPDVLGRRILLDGEPFEVIGVMPPGLYPTWAGTEGQIHFEGDNQQFWVPHRWDERRRQDRNSHVLGVIARLRGGADLKALQAEMDSIAERLEAAYPQANRDEAIQVNPLPEEVYGNYRLGLLFLLAATGTVLLIACANLSSLLLSRAAQRQKEAAVRRALGAGNAALVRQFLVESVALALIGGLLGVFLAALFCRVAPNLLPSGIPRLESAQLNLAVLGFALLLSLAAGLAFGLAPALQVSRANLLEHLNQAGRWTAPAGPRTRLRHMLVVSQVALAVLLAVTSGLLVRSFWKLTHVDPGFEPVNVLVADLQLPFARYAQQGQIESAYGEIMENVRAMPGVVSAALAYDHPLESNWYQGFRIVGQPEPEPGKTPVARLRPVGEDYFITAGIPLLEGRAFDRGDRSGRPGAAMVNQAFVERFFAPLNQDPLGQVLQINNPWGGSAPSRFEIVGLVGNVRFQGLDAPSEPAYYLPARQFPLQDMSILVRGRDPLRLADGLRRSLWRVEPEASLSDVTTLSALLGEAVGQPRFRTVLLGLFAALALGLSAIGLYGLLASLVSLRTRELGVRLAVGARPVDIVWLVLGHGLALTAAGLAIGLLASLAATRWLNSLLYETGATDPWTFAAAAATLLLAATFACCLPARRAGRTNVIEALR